MRVVLTTESWPSGAGATLGAPAVAEIAARAWRESSPGAEASAIAVGDGGPRTADAFAAPRAPVGGAEACLIGAHTVLAPRGGALRWDPHDLFAALAGLAAATARGERAGTVVVPLGDEAPAGDAVDLWVGGLSAARAALAPLSLVALVGASRPLLGFRGMAAATMAGRESDAAVAAAAQEQETRWAGVALEGDAVASPRALVGASRLSDAPGAGAAGGLAYGVAALGATLRPGAAYAAALAGLDAAARGADLVVAICRDLSPRGVDHGTVRPASEAAAAHGVPCVAIAPEVGVGKRDLMAAGISGAYGCEPGAAALADRVARVAATWTPRA